MMLQTKNLIIGYKGVQPVQANLDLALDEGQLLCLIGPNGMGKSTLLRTLAHLQKPLGGVVLVNGKDVSKMSNRDLALSVSLVLTDRINVPNLKVSDLVFAGRYPHTSWLGGKSAEDRRIVDDALRMTNLAHKRDAFVDELSDGERQRAMIAKALAQDTPIMLLDEPTSHLDLPNRVEMVLLLRQLVRSTRKTIVFSCHELELALQCADLIWLMDKAGVKSGIPEDLVLDGSIEHCFVGKNLTFDKRNGTFKMKYQKEQKIRVEIADEVVKLWTVRALQRNGFEVVENAATTIYFENGAWCFNDKIAETLADVVKIFYVCNRK